MQEECYVGPYRNRNSTYGCDLGYLPAAMGHPTFVISPVI